MMENKIRIKTHYLKTSDNQLCKTTEFYHMDSWDSIEVLTSKLFKDDDSKITEFKKISDFLEVSINEIENAFDNAVAQQIIGVYNV